MSTSDTDRMVLRTVYLPPELDQRMKRVAYREDRSKNDIVRELIVAGLKALEAEKPDRFSDPRIDDGVASVEMKRAPRVRVIRTVKVADAVRPSKPKGQCAERSSTTEAGHRREQPGA